jgi:hypothetical protein
MRRMHRRFPEFGFDHNKGYGTPEHLEVLDRLGPTPIHRLSFACVGQPAIPGLGPSELVWAAPPEAVDEDASRLPGRESMAPR